MKPIQDKSGVKTVGALLVLAVTSTVSMVLHFLDWRATDFLGRRGETYVQQCTGEAIAVRERHRLYRTQETLHAAVKEWTQLTFSLDYRTPGQGEQQTDPGFEVADVVVPTPAYMAAFAYLPDGFYQEWLRLYREQIMPDGILEGEVYSIINITYISNPREIDDWTWEVDILATRTDIGRGAERASVPFNRTFTIKAIEPDQESLWGEEEPSAFKRAYYRLRRRGVQFTEIVEYVP